MTRHSATRLVLSFLWIFSIVVAATYVANIVASLTVPRFVLPVNSLTDLVAQSQFTYGTLKSSALVSTFHVCISGVLLLLL